MCPTDAAKHSRALRLALRVEAWQDEGIAIARIKGDREGADMTRALARGWGARA
jgi:hypothetical protein